MNNAIYKLSSLFFKDKLNLETLNKMGIENLYNFYQQGSKILNYNIDINKDEFQNIFELINKVLILRVSFDD